MKVPQCLAWTAALVIAMGLSGYAQAQSILVDIGNSTSYRGADSPSPDGNGNYWNSVWSGAYYPDLVDKAGASSGVSLGFSSAGGTDSYNGPAGDTTINGPGDTVYNAAALGDLGVDEAVYDFYLNSTIELQNLDPAKTYDLTFYGSHKYNSNNNTRYSVYTDATYTTLVASGDLLVGMDDAHNQDTTVTLSGLSPQVANILYLKFEGVGGGSGYLNALQIDGNTPVPEPASLALLASIVAGGLGLRRR